MKCLGLVFLTALGQAFLASGVAAAPVIPGLFNKHPLTEPQMGRLLIGELRCVACHTRTAPSLVPERLAPDLSAVGARVAPDYLQRFLASPSTTHAGTTMPDLLAGESAAQRARIAEGLTHFLIASSPRPWVRQPIGAQDAAEGKVLFHTIGCVACHAPREDRDKKTSPDNPRSGPESIDLAHVPGKYSLTSLTDFLFQPLRVRPSGRMPDMKLTQAEAKALASYLLGSSDVKTPNFQVQDNLVALGKEQFQRLNCGACHQVNGIPAPRNVGALEGADLTRGCLSGTPGKAPWFHLTGEQTKAIRAALVKKADPISDKERLVATLTAFNCLACHVRDDYGGVREAVNELFRSSEKELGDEGRIPPPLTLVGAKLQKGAMKKVLFEGDSVRSYMATRMPQFGEANLQHLPDLLDRLDSVKSIEFSLPRSEGGTKAERDREREMRTAGRDLVGDQGLYCIACHSFNGKTPNKQGIDLLTVNQRLQPNWYYHFLRDPNRFRPRTIMPKAWPDGIAAHQKILNGDTNRQIEAIWYYLSLGTSAQDPSGIRATETLLQATDAPRTYRGRSSVAGFRGIAVGFPAKVNYAFNAETGTLSALWRGDFVRVNRSGQGSGNFQPAARFVALAQDLSFFNLPNETTPWPLRPVMTKEAPVNPDPLYPKNLGYQFLGYHLDEASVPTLMYRSGAIAIEDRLEPLVPSSIKSKTLLVRRLTFDSPKDQTVWFRSLTGKIDAESKQQFKTSELRLSIPEVPTVLRPTAADPKVSELLLKLGIPKGQSTQTLTYEILP